MRQYGLCAAFLSVLIMDQVLVPVVAPLPSTVVVPEVEALARAGDLELAAQRLGSHGWSITEGLANQAETTLLLHRIAVVAHARGRLLEAWISGRMLVTMCLQLATTLPQGSVEFDTLVAKLQDVMQIAAEYHDKLAPFPSLSSRVPGDAVRLAAVAETTGATQRVGLCADPSAAAVHCRGDRPGAAWPSPTDTVTTSPIPSSRIAIVSLCSYNSSSTPLAALSAANKRSYAKKHGYALHFETRSADMDRLPAWSKIPLLAKYLRVGNRGADGTFKPAYDWVMWMDCDSFFMDQGKELQDVIHAGVGQGGQSAQFIVGEDGALVNTGIFFLRVSRWSLAFLRHVYGYRVGSDLRPTTQSALRDGRSAVRRQNGYSVESPFKQHGHWEQAAVVAMLYQGMALPHCHTAGLAVPGLVRSSESSPLGDLPPITDGATGFGSQGGGDAATRSGNARLFVDPWGPSTQQGRATHLEQEFDVCTVPAATVIVPQRWINGYPPVIAQGIVLRNGETAHEAFREGDFIVSFSGCRHSLGQPRCNALFLRYANAAHGEGQSGA